MAKEVGGEVGVVLLLVLVLEAAGEMVMSFPTLLIDVA